MKFFHPDDSGLLPAPDKKKREEEEARKRGGGGPQGLLSPFFPGQDRMLANQMSFGFGGDPGGIAKQLQMLHSRMPVNFKYGRGSGFGLPGGQPVAATTTGAHGSSVAPGGYYTGSPIGRPK